MVWSGIHSLRKRNDERKGAGVISVIIIIVYYIRGLHIHYTVRKCTEKLDFNTGK